MSKRGSYAPRAPSYRRRVFNCIAANPGIQSPAIAKLMGVELKKVQSATSGLSEDRMIRNRGGHHSANWEVNPNHPGPSGVKGRQKAGMRPKGVPLFTVAPCELERVMWPLPAGRERQWVAREFA